MQNTSNFIERGIKYFILISLFFSASNSLELKNYIEEYKLYENSYWAKLLHYRNGISEIDSTNFFISNNGKEDLKEELFETINSLETGTNNVLCRFPLRVEWLKENIPTLEEKIVPYSCEELDKFLELTDAKYVTMVFPTAHINSPASMYGHTFLKVGGDKETPLISNAINYAAKTDEKNGLIFAYNGLFGGYEGRYSIMPYYEKIKEYNNLEQRDVWEYDLNLSQEEINKLVLHTWELKDSYADYYFFKENCSYNVLWLLEIARPSLDLVSYFDFKAIPLDTIKILTKYDGLIVDSRYRYSNLKKMKHILNEEIENKEFLKAYINDEIELPDSLSQSDKISYLDFKIAYTQYQRSEDGTEKKEYIKNYLKLLKERSSYKQTRTYNIKSPLDPLISHDSARIGLFYDSNDSFETSIKPAYNDMYDIVDGYLQGAYIDFFELNFKKQKDKDVKLDRFTLIKIKSYSPQDMIFKPISWGIDAGYEHFKDKDDYFKIKPEVGVSFGNDKDFIYSMLGSNIYYKGNDQLYSAGVNIGFITNRIENFNIGVNYTYDKYNKSLENNQFEAFTTYKVHRNLALNLKYINDDLYEKQDRVKVGVMFYF
ncbi:Lnb N-terminal periplasmic domain-containing protein [Aliarcobacter butzleri]|uniref:DUF4105 domain-containing protein n=2 Tax=Aliarcobacter butzleri TaxID=28197 RepID=A0AAP4UYG3_9BACT|nr:DUF4105 domain-containing protein [Aliarcobacter butzleri]MCG3675382.1 DUF4105 domain-containing protein [Aliarcobacter butzleri]MCG3682230.1 DUF4105 domain-containing protein [Aliarcobacter butzleri]MCG3708124.1 DUF4105 domain-containing protein [Aliarcobacter butzleri]MDN5052054.1 DUF4105 domain-containing protein [Aliarcobacter butzleri]MDN5076131.1 DUF4105 domain-containing protein [Aliarcobacter butzleri]